jgi:hypothetical protein
LRTATLRAAARGLVAAMAMTGSRTVSAGLAPEEQTPPEAIVSRHAPKPFERLPRKRRAAVTELAHWAYGTGGGVVFGLLPARVRRVPGAGVAYGLLIWLAFELAIGPALGAARTRRRPVLWRTLIAGDHILYGLVVAGRLAPEPAISSHRGERGESEPSV